MSSARETASCVHRPSRRDLRSVRTILSKIVDGEPCHELERIATFSVSHVIRFLAAVRGLEFVFVGHTRNCVTFGYCGPDEASGRKIGCRVLSAPLQHEPSPSAPSVSIGKLTCRERVVIDAVERVAEILEERVDILFALAWQVGDSDIQFDYSWASSRATAADEIRRFLTERLDASIPSPIGEEVV